MQKLKNTYSLIFWVLLKYFVRIKKYSRGAGGQVFVIYGQPMESNIFFLMYYFVVEYYTYMPKTFQIWTREGT
jgi:hypothetical protein